MDHWEFTKRTGTIVALSGAVVALSWFCFTTVARINKLEAQMQALVISPAASPNPPNIRTAPATPNPQTNTPTEVNPLMLVCADLAGKLYEKYKDSGGIPALNPISGVMDQLGCKPTK